LRISSGGVDMPEKTVFDQYKEMIEKTKQLHSELVELSSKVDGMVVSMDTGMSDSVTSAKRVSMSDSDVNTSADLGKYSESSSLKKHGSGIDKY
jgi:hypothetical protein